MKKCSLTMAFVIVMSGASFAQVSVGGGVHSGLAFTSFPEPYTDFYGIGFGGGLHGDLDIIPALGLRLNFDYNTFPFDNAKLRERLNLDNSVDFTGANVTVLAITANALGKLSTGSVVRPYGILGFGLHIFSQSNLHATVNGQDAGTLPGAPTATKFGLNFGSGVEFALGRRTNLFVEAKYALSFDSGGTSSYLPVTLGVSF